MPNQIQDREDAASAPRSGGCRITSKISRVPDQLQDRDDAESAPRSRGCRIRVLKFDVALNFEGKTSKDCSRNVLSFVRSCFSGFTCFMTNIVQTKPTSVPRHCTSPTICSCLISPMGWCRNISSDQISSCSYKTQMLVNYTNLKF